MILERDGTTKDIGLMDLSVSLKLPIKNQDASGNGSNTATLNTGTKAKTLSIAGRIPFSSADNLTDLIKLAEALNSDGTRAIYTIVDDTADAADITTVQFNGDLDARKIPDLQAWAVTFGLSEYLSTAERVEAQRNAGYTSSDVAADSALGTEVAGAAGNESGIDKEGFVYKLFRKVDDYLATLDTD